MTRALSLVLLLAATPLPAAELSTDPVLRIEAGMHTALNRRISANASGTVALTVSEDKTARLWSLQEGEEGKLLRVLRPPLGEGYEGKLYCGMLSPDGTLAAVGGWTSSDGLAESIYLFDTSSGRLVRCLGGLPEAVFDLAFSPGGTRLAVGLGVEEGIRVWDVATGQLLGEDSDYEGPVYGLDWHGEDRLASSSDDGQVRLYEVAASGLRKLRSVATESGEEPFALRFSPDGARLAVGFSDVSAVEVRDARNLSLLFVPDTSGVDSGILDKVAWSADGRTLAAGGSWNDGNGHNPVRLWSQAGRGPFHDVLTSQNAIMDLRPLPGGDFLFATDNPAWGILSESGAKTLGAPPVADYRGLLEAFRLAPDGTSVAFWFYDEASPAVFHLSQTKLVSEEADPSDDLRSPRTEGLEVTDWEDTTEPKLDGEALPLERSEISRSLAIASDASCFLLGTEWYLRCFEADGQERWSIPAPGAAWAVNLTEDGRYAVAAYHDGTIRWHDLKDGRELLVFFPHADRERWVFWAPAHHGLPTRGFMGVEFSPVEGGGVEVSEFLENSPAAASLAVGDHVLRLDGEAVSDLNAFVSRVGSHSPGDKLALAVVRDGRTLDIEVTLGEHPVKQYRTSGAYFASSEGGQDLIGWHVNRGKAEEADFYSADQLWDSFHRPDIVQRVLAEARPAGDIAKELGIVFDLKTALRQTPRVALSGVDDGAAVATGTLRVTVEAQDTGGGLNDLAFYHNGKRLPPDGPPVEGRRGGQALFTETYVVTLEPGQNLLKAQAANDAKTLGYPAQAIVHFRGEQANADLHFFAIGLNTYLNPALNLTYCVPDAEATAAAFRERAGGLFANAHVHLLADDQATKSNIEAKFAELAASVKPQDVFVFCYAGHGVMGEAVEDGGDHVFYLVPHDVTQLYGNPERLAEKAVSRGDLEAWCAKVPARKQLMLLDTCQSGGLVDSFAMRGAAEQKAIAQLARATGTVVIASTGAEAFARESAEIGHGIFTKALLDGLAEAKADANKDGRITVKELELHINEAVPELSRELTGAPQFPTSYSRGQDFPVGVVR